MHHMKRLIAGIGVAALLLVGMVAGASPASAQDGSTPQALCTPENGIIVGDIGGNPLGVIGPNFLCALAGPAFGFIGFQGIFGTIDPSFFETSGGGSSLPGGLPTTLGPSSAPSLFGPSSGGSSLLGTNAIPAAGQAPSLFNLGNLLAIDNESSATPITDDGGVPSSVFAIGFGLVLTAFLFGSRLLAAKAAAR
jgi:hypothetical protein